MQQQVSWREMEGSQPSGRRRGGTAGFNVRITEGHFVEQIVISARRFGPLAPAPLGWVHAESDVDRQAIDLGPRTGAGLQGRPSPLAVLPSVASERPVRR